MKSTQTHRNEGFSKEIGGKAKKTVGKVIGDERMQAEGEAKEAEGRLQKGLGKAGERVKGVKEEITGRLRQKINRPD